MVVRAETHLNVPLKSRMKNLTWEQAAKYGINHNLSSSGVNIASVKQDGDKLVIIKRLNTKKSMLFNWGFSQKGGLKESLLIEETKAFLLITLKTAG